MAPLPTETPQDALLSSAFRHLPFSSPPPPTAPKSPSASPRSALEETVNAADRILNSLAAAASGHPFSRTVHSLTSEFRSFFQVRFSAPRIPNSVSTHNFAAILPGDSVAGLVVANGINNFLNLYNTLLVVRLVLTWFPNSPPAIVAPLSTICDPYLNIFRGIIPPLGGTLDLSPILAFLVLNAFTSTAAALPAELPAAIVSDKHASAHPILQNLSSTREKWIKRVSSKVPRN